MGLDPPVAPVIVRAPGTRVQMKGGEVQGVDSEVRSEVEALAELVRVAAVALQAEALVAERDEVVRVEALDVRRRLGGPLRDDARGAPVAARLVGELPRQDRRRVGVPRHHGLHVGAVLLLRRGVGVEAVLGPAERPRVLLVY